MGPREGLLPSGQAAGRWYFPPPLCADDMDAARPGIRRQTHASLLAAFHTCERMQAYEVRKGQCRDRPIAEWLNWLCENGSVPGRC